MTTVTCLYDANPCATADFFTRGKSEAIFAHVDLVSQLLDDSIYGDSGVSIAALDRSFEKKWIVEPGMDRDSVRYPDDKHHHRLVRFRFRPSHRRGPVRVCGGKDTRLAV